MRPELKKIRESIKTAGATMQNNPAWCEPRSDRSEHAWLKRHCLKLKSPVEVKAGTKWIQKSSSGNVKGVFLKPCKIIGVIEYVGYEVVLDKPSSTSEECMAYGRPDFLNIRESVSAMPTDILKKIVEQLP